MGLAKWHHHICFERSLWMRPFSFLRMLFFLRKWGGERGKKVRAERRGWWWYWKRWSGLRWHVFSRILTGERIMKRRRPKPAGNESSLALSTAHSLARKTSTNWVSLMKRNSPWRTGNTCADMRETTRFEGNAGRRSGNLAERSIDTTRRGFQAEIDSSDQVLKFSLFETQSFRCYY